jgi:hypothetical protein
MLATLFLVATLASVPWSLICLIVSLILLFLAAFVGPPTTDGPFYRRLNLGWAGLFFYVLAVALG